MPETTLVAAGQFPSTPGDVAGNVEAATTAIREAVSRDASLVVLPEFCLSGYDAQWIRDGAPGGGLDPSAPAMATIAELTARHPVTVVFNDLERSDGRFFSTSFVLAGGAVAGSHRKTILTEGERLAGLVAGDRAASPVTTATLPVPVGPMVCFEHGFPEIALDLALAGAGVLAISSAISKGTEYLRNLRTRARAQDNGCYAVAANAVGNDYCGESMIVDPRGDVLVRASTDRSEVIVAELRPATILEERRKEPVLTLRRPELRGPH